MKKDKSQKSGFKLNILRIFIALFFVFTALRFPLYPIYAQEEGSSCTYVQGDQVCIGLVQGGLCQYSDKIGPNCNKKGTAEDVFGFVSVPGPIAGLGFGAKGVSNFLSVGMQLVYVSAAIIFTVMLLWASFQWMTAGGDKENVAKARSRIINAFIGLGMLALAPLIFTILSHITGFDFPLTLNPRP